MKMSVKDCCQSELEWTYSSFLKQINGRESPTLGGVVKNWIQDNLKKVDSLILHCDIRVVEAHSKDSARALRLTITCPKCGTTSNMLILTANLMLMNWRLGFLAAQMFDGTKIREPTSNDMLELRAIVNSYLNDTPDWLDLQQLQTIANQYHNRDVMEALLHAQMAGTAWILLHELAHSIEESLPDSQEFAQIRQTAESYVVELDLDPLIEQQWIDEFVADLWALRMLINGIAISRNNDKTLPAEQRRESAIIALGGVGSVLNCLMFIRDRSLENADQYDEKLLKHPPNTLRANLACQFASIYTKHPLDRISGTMNLFGTAGDLVRKEYLKDSYGNHGVPTS